MTKRRLDNLIVSKGLASTRSQAENLIRLGEVKVDDRVIKKPGYFVGENVEINITAADQYVSRAALKLASVAEVFGVDFKDRVVLDVGSSTGGFTEFSLKNGAKKVIAVEVGTNQMHPSLRDNPKIELHEKTDIRDFVESNNNSQVIDIVVVDVSFVSLRDILPSVIKISNASTEIYAMVKPQFEAINDNLKHKGVIKNDKIRRQILKDFEEWAQGRLVIINKADSKIHGSKGNIERFYKLKLPK